MKGTFKRIICLSLVLALSAFLFGCSSKKQKELSENDYKLVESTTRLAVVTEVLEKYGKEPGMTIEKTTAYDNGDTKFRDFTFYTSGSYVLIDSSGQVYSGTFKVMGHIEPHGTGLDEVEITEPKCGKETFPTLSSGATIIVDGIPTEEKTIQTTAETTKPELKNEDMITLAESYKKAGYSIMIKDPSNEHQQCYGAIEHFRAYNNTKFYDVFLYENAEAAENAQYMMYGEGPDRLNGAHPDTQIVNERILIAEYN